MSYGADPFQMLPKTCHPLHTVAEKSQGNKQNTGKHPAAPQNDHV